MPSEDSVQTKHRLSLVNIYCLHAFFVRKYLRIRYQLHTHTHPPTHTHARTGFSQFLLSDLFHIQKYPNCRATGGVSIKVRTHFQTNYNLIAIVNTIINVFKLAKVSPNKLHKNAKKYTTHTNSTNIILDAYK